MITHVNFGGERTYTTGLVRFSDTMSQARIGRRNNGEAVRGTLINFDIRYSLYRC